MNAPALLLLTGFGLLAALYFRAAWWVFAVWLAATLGFGWWALGQSTGLCITSGLALFWLLIAAPTPLRRLLFTGPIFAIYRKILPPMSSTEREAIDAGSVWWDGELFSGKPNWNKLFSFPKPQLTEAEQSFLDNEVETLCQMLDDWKITTELNDLPPEAWQYIKANGFFGLIIPKTYGGKGFSNYAHSQVVMKVASRSGSAAVTVMVPNSLGPAELLLHYGTDQQKNHYLPRLARGDEIPCFGLTSPDAGSDAGGIPDFGVVCMGEWQGQMVKGVRLTWEKRYITLGPVATVLGLAFKLYDPDKLLGDKKDIGVTLALIPSNHPGVNIGRRHYPLNCAFMNGPNWGRDVFIPMDYLIGGVPYVGQGWRMLMECLAVGRSISLPSMGVASAKFAAATTGAYARVRTQFNLPVGKFEGVEEALARIGGMCYLVDGVRELTLTGLDLGEKPSVLSGIVKYHLTERMRHVLNDAMDVHGGKGICMGPNNYLARAYQAIPIGITVEGANILTRSMIIFGQGAIRCHPFVLKEMLAAQSGDLDTFDAAFSAHLGFIAQNKWRSFWLGLTGAQLCNTPLNGRAGRYLQLLTRQAAQLAFMADVAMFSLGGQLKFKEKLSARLGDVLSGLHLASGALKRFVDQGQLAEDEPLLAWSVEQTLYENQQALLGLIDNFPRAWMRPFLRLTVFPLGAGLTPPSDQVGHEVAKLLMAETGARQRLLQGIFLPKNAEEQGVGVLLAAFHAVMAHDHLEAKIRAAQRAGQLSALGSADRLEEARNKGVITPTEYDQLVETRRLKRATVMVDDFDPQLKEADNALFERTAV